MALKTALRYKKRIIQQWTAWGWEWGGGLLQVEMQSISFYSASTTARQDKNSDKNDHQKKGELSLPPFRQIQACW